MKYHHTVSTIRTLLDNNTVQYDTFEHKPVRTCEEASTVRKGYTIEQGAKAIVVRVREPGKGKRFVMFVLPGSKKFDTATVKSISILLMYDLRQKMRSLRSRMVCFLVACHHSVIYLVWRFMQIRLYLQTIVSFLMRATGDTRLA